MAVLTQDSAARNDDLTALLLPFKTGIGHTHPAGLDAVRAQAGKVMELLPSELRSGEKIPSSVRDVLAYKGAFEIAQLCDVFSAAIEGATKCQASNVSLYLHIAQDAYLRLHERQALHEIPEGARQTLPCLVARLAPSVSQAIATFLNEKLNA